MTLNNAPDEVNAALAALEIRHAIPVMKMKLFLFFTLFQLPFHYAVRRRPRRTTNPDKSPIANAPGVGTGFATKMLENETESPALNVNEKRIPIVLLIAGPASGGTPCPKEPPLKEVVPNAEETV